MSSTKDLNRPLFIIGSPRSGTSLLRLILTSHSQVLIPPECGFIIWLQNKYADWTASHNSDAVRIASFVEDLFASKKFDTWMLSKAVIKDQIAFYQPANFGELCAVVYVAFGVNTGKKFSVWGDKNNFYLNHMPELRSLYEGARFIHIVRDGRDVACSYREVMAANSNSPYAPNLETDIARIATEWSNNVTKVDLFMSTLPSDAALTIKYEDLVVAPKKIAIVMCDWIGIPFEEKMLNFYQQNLSKKLEPKLTLDWKKRTLEPISADTVGRYASLLSNKDQKDFIAVGTAALKRFAYI